MDANRTNPKGPQPHEGKTTMEGRDLESVIERARGHDTEALGEIYRRYVRRVFGLCRYMLDSRESAEDATSEVFLKLQRLIESYDGSIPFPKWLLRVTGNQCIDALRRRKRGQQVIVEVEDGTAVIEAASPGAVAAGRCPQRGGEGAGARCHCTPAGELSPAVGAALLQRIEL